MAELLKNIQSYWDMRAGGFSDASMEERKTEPGERWENIFKNSLKTGCHVLDDGCGAGFFTTLLASMGFQVTAVDYSTKMLEEVRRNLETEGLKAELHQMDVQSLEFADNSFDAVVSRNVFWNLEHADKAYEEAYRVLIAVFLVISIRKPMMSFSVDMKKKNKGAMRDIIKKM